LDLQHKTYIKDGMMMRHVNGKPKERYVVIYTDLILICIQTTVRGPPKYELESGYVLAELNFKQDLSRKIVVNL
jgi:hypothetical protein